MDKTDIKLLIDEAFEDLALVLGGIFAVHTVSDEAIWQIMKHIDVVHGNLVAQLEGTGPDDINRNKALGTEPHPAVEALLLKLRKRNSSGDLES